MRARFWRPRHTIGGLMATIALIALVLTALRPLSALLVESYPAFAAAIRHWSTPETWIVLSCLAAGAFVTMKLLSLDERS